MMHRFITALIIIFSWHSVALAGWTVYTPPQITPATVVRPALLGGNVSIENPQQVTPLLGTTIYYTPPGYDRFSADPEKRRVLLSDPNGTETESDVIKTFPKVLDDKYNRLWEAASAWERKHISGVGLSLLSLGIVAGKPKSMAVAAWSAKLWNETYYPRKNRITLTSAEELDFTAVGEMPYGVTELSAEVWGSQ